MGVFASSLICDVQVRESHFAIELVIAMEQGIPEVGGIKREAIANMWKLETRRYVFHPNRLVQDVRTGIQLPDLNSALDGNIEPLIEANISMRQASDLTL